MLQFVEDFCTGEKGGGWEKTTPTTCIGGAVLKGHATFGGLLKDLVRILERNYCRSGQVLAEPPP